MRREKPLDDLEARLAREWGRDDGQELSARWKSGVMSAVRAEARAHAAAGPPLERLVRDAFLLAAAAAAAAAVVALVRTGALEPARVVTRLVASDLEGVFDLVLVL